MPGQDYCSRGCATEDAYDAGGPSWVGVSSWDLVSFGTRVKLIVGGERIVGTYTNAGLVGALVTHTIASDAVGDVTITSEPGAMEELFVEVWDAEEHAQRSAIYFRERIAEAAGVSVERAEELGF